jgi:rRNA maturation endonuclease Nob1
MAAFVLFAATGNTLVHSRRKTMPRHTCLCLGCGRHFELCLAEGEDPTEEKCPLCGGGNVVKHNPTGFFNSLFGGPGGG